MAAQHDPKIIRHQTPSHSGPQTFSGGDAQLMDAVGNHLQKYVGPDIHVLHELVSPDIHLDVYVVAASPKRPFITLCTCGCAERPMKQPLQLDGNWKYAELMCALPATWKLPELFKRMEDTSAAAQDRWFFPVEWLKTFARLPHTYNSWIFQHHTLPNGDPPQPYAPGVDFCCVMLQLPYAFDPAVFELRLGDRLIHFWGMIPLFREELDFKLKRGPDLLEQKLAPIIKDIGFPNLFDPARPNACKRKFFGFF